MTSTGIVPIHLSEKVIFPGCGEQISLHDSASISMVRECLSQGSVFGCIPLRQGRQDMSLLYRVGTLVETLALRESQGRPVEVTVLGKERFKVIEQVVTGQLITARIIKVNDMETSSKIYQEEIAMLKEEILECYEKFSLRYPGRFTPINEEVLKNATDTEFSFLVAGHTRIPRDDCISLLEMTSTRDRLRKLLECIRAVQPVQSRLL